jgi:adenylate cyclase
MIGRRRLSGLIAGVVALGIGLLAGLAGLAGTRPSAALRDIVFDSFQRLSPRPFDAAMPVRIVDIDEASLARFGQWPWPRSDLARLVEAIGRRGAAVIGLDIVLAEPDRAAPEHLLAALPASPERQALAERLTREGVLSGDRALAEVMARYRVVAGIVLTGETGPVPVASGIAVAGADPRPSLTRFAGAVAPLALLQPAFKGFGALNWVPEYDQVVRRVPALLDAGGTLVPALALEALRLAGGGASIIVRTGSEAGGGVNALRAGGQTIRTDRDGGVRLRYSGSRPERWIPAWKLLADDVPRGEIEGRLILVGTSAAALGDRRATPLEPAVPGVEIHAELIEHILSGARLTRPDWAGLAEALAAVIVALLAGLAAHRLAPLGAAGVAGVLMAGAGAASWQAFVGHDLLLSPLAPGLAALAAFVVLSVLRWRTVEAERRAVRDAFAHYLSPAMVQRLAEAPEQLRLGGERRELTVLFSDVRGFTRLGEAVQDDPQALTRLMNRLLTPLSAAILDRSGTIDKYMGDAILAFWNAPLDVSDHAGKAVAAALDMRRRLAVLNAELSAEAVEAGRGFSPLAVGIGLNSGTAVVGNMGSDVRFDYSVLGDAVNLASRLQELTRAYGFDILVGDSTAAAVANRFALVEIDTVRVRGRAGPQRIHALLGDVDLLQDEAARRVAAGIAAMLEAYRAGDWKTARGGLVTLEKHAKAFGLDGYIWLMRRRMGGEDAAPEGWDGISQAPSG